MLQALLKDYIALIVVEITANGSDYVLNLNGPRLK